MRDRLDELARCGGGQRLIPRSALALAENFHGRIRHFAEKPIENGSANEEVPARSLRLTDDHVGDAFATGELDQSVNRACGRHSHNRCSKALCKSHVPGKCLAVLGCDAVGALFRRFDVDSIQTRPRARQPSARHAE